MVEEPQEQLLTNWGSICETEMLPDAGSLASAHLSSLL